MSPGKAKAGDVRRPFARVWNAMHSGGLLPGLDTACTHVYTLFDPVLNHTDPLSVGLPRALRVAHRVAHIMPKLWRLAANLTLGHSVTPC